MYFCVFIYVHTKRYACICVFVVEGTAVSVGVEVHMPLCVYMHLSVIWHFSQEFAWRRSAVIENPSMSQHPVWSRRRLLNRRDVSISSGWLSIFLKENIYNVTRRIFHFTIFHSLEIFSQIGPLSILLLYIQQIESKFFNFFLHCVER